MQIQRRAEALNEMDLRRGPRAELAGSRSACYISGMILSGRAFLLSAAPAGASESRRADLVGKADGTLSMLWSRGGRTILMSLPGSR